MKQIVILFIITTFISCKKENIEKGNLNKEYPITTATPEDFNDYKDLALNKGDTSAYYQLSLDYMDSPYDGFLYTALIMANKYDYHIAYYDVYEFLTDKANGIDNLDKSTRDMALCYLKKGAEKENRNCMSILGHFYIEGEHVPKDISKGEKLIKGSGIE